MRLPGKTTGVYIESTINGSIEIERMRAPVFDLLQFTTSEVVGFEM